MSPQKTQLVLIGYRKNPLTTLSEYALIAIDILRNEPYAVPFDRTDTRFVAIWEATPDWFALYFDWTVDGQGQERLTVRQFSQLPYWQGRWVLIPGDEQPWHYELRPVLPGMVAPFVACIQQEYPVSDLTIRETEDRIIAGFTIMGIPQGFDIYKRTGTLTWYCDDSVMARRVGQAFDRELATGQFQHLFGRFDTD